MRLGNEASDSWWFQPTQLKNHSSKMGSSWPPKFSGVKCNHHLSKQLSFASNHLSSDTPVRGPNVEENSSCWRMKIQEEACHIELLNQQVPERRVPTGPFNVRFLDAGSPPGPGFEGGTRFFFCSNNENVSKLETCEKSEINIRKI